MNRQILYGTSAVLFLMIGAPAFAQVPQAAEQGGQAAGAPEEVAEVIVTGTRLTSGFQTPTPVTTLTAEQLQAASPGNLADVTQRLPAFRGSPNTGRRQGGSPNSTGGQNLLNLRGMGAQRNLVLLNGQRIVASNASGSVDVNLIPQDMVRNIEVVTGGASAAYGSDAVTGVVNFILDTSFQGLKGSVQAGATNYWDAESVKGNLAWGRHFLDGRLRVIASGEAMYGAGIDTFQAMNRDWWSRGGGIVSNPVSGAVPRQIITTNVRSASMTYGGLVPSGPLKGTAFGPDGVPYTHDFGVQSGIWQVGGNGILALPGLTPKQERYTGYIHAEYDVSDTLVVKAEANWGRTNNVLQSYPNYENGQFAFTIFDDNAFLSPIVKARMAAAGVTSIPVGRHSRDLKLEEIDAIQETKRASISFEKQLWNDWRLDGYYTRGLSRQDTDANNMTINRNLYAAADAVVDPATGRIVCRSQLFGLDPDCVPMNIFGDGSISEAAEAYVLGSSIRNLDLTQDVAQLNLSGDLPDGVSLGAGPISFAVGAEYRKESSKQWSDPISRQVTDFTGIRGGPASLNNRPGALQTFNPVPFDGEYSVTEGYVEVGVPVFEDVPGAKSLAVNAAARAADYSNSGLATSWKFGATYEPVQDIRFRGTVSLDIRGPNILELFNPRSTNASNVLYGGVRTGYTGFSTGNPNLKPEKSMTTTVGVVYQPSFAPGLSLSADVYKIELEDAIAQLGAQGIVDQCERGSATNCALIEQAPGGSLIITNPYQNLNYMTVEGLDLEALYTTEFAGGNLTLRALANYTSKFETQTPGAEALDEAGDLSADQPKWQANFQAQWRRGPLSLFVMERYVGGGKYNAAWEDGVDVNDNDVDSVFYTDVTVRYDFRALDADFTWFLTIQNLLDTDPRLLPQPSTFQQTTNANIYDTLGRYTTTGLRFRF